MLCERCVPLLEGPGPYDVAVNQATQVLECALRSEAEHAGRETGQALVSAVINGNPYQAQLMISLNHAEQEGFANLCRGIMQYYRNPTHHDMRNIDKNEALAVCALIDQIIQKVEQASLARKIARDIAHQVY